MNAVRTRLILIASVLVATVAAAAPPQSQVPTWGKFQASLESERTYENPLQQVELRATFVSPSGKQRTVLGFWDGGRSWSVRFSPDEVGQWKYTTTASEASDKGLNGKSGAFSCAAPAGEASLYQHGAIRLSPDRFNLVHSDGTPFFWLADTAWNGALKAAIEDWNTYLQDRRSKRFTAIQFVAEAPWRACPTDRDGNVAFTGKEKIAIQPAFFQRMDKYFDAINAADLVAVPVLLWAIRGDMNPGWALPEDQAILLVRYMVARYGANHVIWILAGDGNYASAEAVKRWTAIGREGLKFNPGRLVTMHPGGMQWPWDGFRDEKWLDVLMYQSGHGDNDASRQWNCVGPPATHWRDEPHRPIINGEINYEGHLSYQTRKPFSDYHVRRATYWSLLASPPAGVTYGVHGVWSWEEKPGVPLAHEGTGEARPWKEAMSLPGSAQLKYLRDMFDRLPWWELRPADEIILERPNDPTFLHCIKAARTASGDWALVYLPDNERVTIDMKPFNGAVLGLWLDPRTGMYSKTIEIPAGVATSRLEAPGKGSDWVLILHKKP
jgi:hypothetical protein